MSRKWSEAQKPHCWDSYLCAAEGFHLSRWEKKKMKNRTTACCFLPTFQKAFGLSWWQTRTEWGWKYCCKPSRRVISMCACLAQLQEPKQIHFLMKDLTVDRVWLHVKILVVFYMNFHWTQATVLLVTMSTACISRQILLSDRALCRGLTWWSPHAEIGVPAHTFLLPDVLRVGDLDSPDLLNWNLAVPRGKLNLTGFSVMLFLKHCMATEDNEEAEEFCQELSPKVTEAFVLHVRCLEIQIHGKCIWSACYFSWGKGQRVRKDSSKPKAFYRGLQVYLDPKNQDYFLFLFSKEGKYCKSWCCSAVYLEVSTVNGMEQELSGFSMKCCLTLKPKLAPVLPSTANEAVGVKIKEMTLVCSYRTSKVFKAFIFQKLPLLLKSLREYKFQCSIIHSFSDSWQLGMWQRDQELN